MMTRTQGAKEAKRLRGLGMTYEAIGKVLAKQGLRSMRTNKPFTAGGVILLLKSLQEGIITDRTSRKFKPKGTKLPATAGRSIYKALSSPATPTSRPVQPQAAPLTIKAITGDKVTRWDIAKLIEATIDLSEANKKALIELVLDAGR